MESKIEPSTQGEHPTNVQRRETRLTRGSLALPFLGSRESDHQPFQYLLEDASPHGARIALPNWVLARERLHQGDLINMHLPFRLHEETFDQGRVAWERWDENQQAQMCGLQREKAPPPFYPVAINLEDNQLEFNLLSFKADQGMLAWLMKDTYLLKKGVSIYLEHLIPYLSRVGNYPRRDFQTLKDVFLFDVQEGVRKSQRRLEELYRQVREGNLPDDEAVQALDMEELRALAESELSTDVLGATFSSPLAVQQLAAIKTLEKRLYANYNLTVMIYLHSLGNPEPDI